MPRPPCASMVALEPVRDHVEGLIPRRSSPAPAAARTHPDQRRLRPLIVRILEGEAGGALRAQPGPHGQVVVVALQPDRPPVLDGDLHRAADRAHAAQAEDRAPAGGGHAADVRRHRGSHCGLRSSCIATSVSGPVSERRTRRTSATDQAWNGQPVAPWGAAPSAVSEMDPRPHSARWASMPVEDPVQWRADADRRIHVGPEQPRPDRALVVRLIPLAPVPPRCQAAVSRVVRRQRPEPERREQGLAAGVDHARGPGPSRRGQRAGHAAARPRAAGWGGTEASSPAGPSTTSSRPVPSSRANRRRNEPVACALRARRRRRRTASHEQSAARPRAPRSTAR